MALATGSQGRLTIAHVVEFLSCFPQDDLFETLSNKEEAVEFLQQLYVPLRSVFAKRGSSSSSRSNGSAANCKRIKSITKPEIPESISSRFPEWRATPNKFWEQAFEEASIESVRSIEKQHRKDVLRIFLTKAFLQAPQLERQLIHNRFVCVSIYQSFSRLFPADRILEGNVEKFLDYAGVSREDTSLCVRLIRGGRSRKMFCQKLQAFTKNDVSTKVDFGPLFILELPDTIWDSRASLDGENFDDALSSLKAAGISEWSEKSGAKSMAKVLLEFQQSLLWDANRASESASEESRKGKEASKRQRTTRDKRERIPQKDSTKKRKRARTEAPNAGSPRCPGNTASTTLQENVGGTALRHENTGLGQPLAQSGRREQSTRTGVHPPIFSSHVMGSPGQETVWGVISAVAQLGESQNSSAGALNSGRVLTCSNATGSAAQAFPSEPSSLVDSTDEHTLISTDKGLSSDKLEALWINNEESMLSMDLNSDCLDSLWPSDNVEKDVLNMGVISDEAPWFNNVEGSISMDINSDNLDSLWLAINDPSRLSMNLHSDDLETIWPDNVQGGTPNLPFSSGNFLAGLVRHAGQRTYEVEDGQNDTNNTFNVSVIDTSVPAISFSQMSG